MDRSATPRVSQLPQSRRPKNRSRSGSEELNQILAQGAAAAARPRGKSSSSMSASSSSSGITTPVPPTEPLARTSSPRLLSWVRSAFLSGPGVRAGAASNLSSEPVAVPTLDEEEEGGEPIDRNSTPLLPGILPLFHQRLSETREEHLPSARSSFSLDTPSSAGNSSLEPLDRSQRRNSSVSTTSTVYDDENSSDSDDEDVYAPFAPKEHGPSLIRPTARREAIPLGANFDDGDEGEGGVLATSSPPHSAQDSRLGIGISHALSGQEGESHLSISEAQDSQQFVRDMTPVTTQPPSVVLTPPDSSPNAALTSPMAGWVNPFQSESEEASMRPDIGSAKTPVPRDFQKGMETGGGQSTDSSVSDHSIVGPMSKDPRSGDGEDLDDVLGRPRSPEEVAKTRPSKESVVLGSRAASTRASGAAPRGQKSTREKKMTVGEDDEERELEEMRAATPMAAMPAAAAITANTEAEQSNIVQTASPQPRRAMNFFTRRRTASNSAAGPDEEVPEGGRTKRESGQGNFWRMGKKQNNALGAVIGADGEPDAILEDRSGKPGGKRASTGLDADKKLPKVPSRSDVVCDKAKESWSKKSARKGTLGPTMQPRAVKVRSRNKSSKDRDFSRVYLAQELFLRSSAGVGTGQAGANQVRAASFDEAAASNGMVKAEGKPPLPHLDSSSSVASSTTTASSTTSAGANGTTGPGQKRRATWAMKFSLDGKYLAVAGQDAVIRVYAVLDSEQARERVELEAARACDSLSPLSQGTGASSSSSLNSTGKNSGGRPSMGSKGANAANALPNLAVFSPEPVKEFKGHTSDILDLSWSKGGFLLSASMDKTARIWHLTWQNSLVSFVHGDFVTSAAFHPRDDRFFLSGSLDGKLRLWNVTAKKVQCSQEVPGLITACAFTESGNTACVGTFAGHALFYQTDGLSYSSSIAVRSPSGKNAKGGRKITCIEPLLPVEASATSKSAERVLITSNDSRVRAYDLRNKSMLARFKAKTYSNRTSQIRAGISDDNTFIVAGSEASSNEGGQVHIWDASSQLSSAGKTMLAKMTTTGSGGSKNASSALSSDSIVEYFTAHAGTVTCAIMAPLAINAHLSTSHDYIVQQTERKLAGNNSNGNGSSAGLAALGAMSLSSAISAAVPNPLKFGSGNGGNPGFTNKLNRIIVSVDESAVVRVWRSDSLKTVEGLDG